MEKKAQWTTLYAQHQLTVNTLLSRDLKLLIVLSNSERFMFTISFLFTISFCLPFHESAHRQCGDTQFICKTVKSQICVVHLYVSSPLCSVTCSANSKHESAEYINALGYEDVLKYKIFNYSTHQMCR